MRAADLATASLLILLGGVVVFDSVRIGIGWGTDGPKSGFFPFWLGVLMIATCGAILLQAWRRAAQKPFVTRERLAPGPTALSPAPPMGGRIQPARPYRAPAPYTGFLMPSRRR